jgi:hypothetical protein
MEFIVWDILNDFYIMQQVDFSVGIECRFPADAFNHFATVVVIREFSSIPFACLIQGR